MDQQIGREIPEETWEEFRVFTGYRRTGMRTANKLMEFLDTAIEMRLYVSEKQKKAVMEACRILERLSDGEYSFYSNRKIPDVKRWSPKQ